MMSKSRSTLGRVLVSLACLVMLNGAVCAQPVEPKYCIFPEQRRLEFRQPEQLRPARAAQLAPAPALTRTASESPVTATGVGL